MTEAAIDAFWDWFVDHQDGLQSDRISEDGVDELTARIESLCPGMGWEVGPGLEKENALVLSPDGDRELLATTRAIVARAPALPGWEVHPARPPKRWDRRFELRSPEGQVAVDATGWRCFVEPDGAGMVRVVVEVGDVGLDHHGAYAAAVIAVEGVLGEAVRLDRVAEIAVARRLAGVADRDAIPLDVLATRLLP